MRQHYSVSWPFLDFMGSLDLSRITLFVMLCFSVAVLYIWNEDHVYTLHVQDTFSLYLRDAGRSDTINAFPPSPTN